MKKIKHLVTMFLIGSLAFVFSACGGGGGGGSDGGDNSSSSSGSSNGGQSSASSLLPSSLAGRTMMYQNALGNVTQFNFYSGNKLTGKLNTEEATVKYTGTYAYSSSTGTLTLNYEYKSNYPIAISVPSSYTGRLINVRKSALEDEYGATYSYTDNKTGKTGSWNVVF